MNNKTLWIRFCPFDLTADRFWRQASCAMRGLYWSLITDLYTEGGQITLDEDQIRRCVNWDEARDGNFKNALKSLLDAKFKVCKNIITHKRVTMELSRADGIKKTREAAGRLGGVARAGKMAAENGQANAKQMPSKCLPFAQANAKHEREEKTREDREDRNRNEYQTTIANTVGHVTFFRFVEAVQRELGVESPSDIATIRNIALFLAETKRDYASAVQVARECKTAKKPIAVFCKRIKTEYQWNPRSAMQC